MSRRYRNRAPARAAKEMSFLSAFDDTEPDDIEPDPRDDEDPDGEGDTPDTRTQTGPLDCSAWSLPT